jgi:hypothetical protein
VKTKNPCACLAVCCKWCKCGIALYLSVIKREYVTQLPINPIVRSRTIHFRRVNHPTRDNTNNVNELQLPIVHCSNKETLHFVYAYSIEK